MLKREDNPLFMEMEKQNLLEGRTKFGSKSGADPDTAIFNAGVYTDKHGIAWRGDIDLKEDIPALLEVAKGMNSVIYVIREGVANDAEYQEKRPKQMYSDWYVWKSA